MVEDYSILEQVEGLESVEDCLNYDSDSDGGGVIGKGRNRGRDPAPPSSVPAGLLVSSVGDVGRHVAAPLGEPDPELRVRV